MKISWLGVLALLVVPAVAGASPPNPMHPVFPLIDEDGGRVSQTGKTPPSDRTCGACHDVTFIHGHSSHHAAGVSATCVTCHVDGGELAWTPESFDDAGNLKRESIRISAPTVQRCSICHGVAAADDAPFALPDDLEASMRATGSPQRYAMTLLTGAIVAPQKMSESRMNLAGKDRLAVPFNVHAARLVTCTACHFAPNDPARIGEERKGLAFLERDPRRPSILEFVRRPDHRLTATTCEQCHDPRATHDSLPYCERPQAAVRQAVAYGTQSAVADQAARAAHRAGAQEP